MIMNVETLKEIIKTELPNCLRQDPSIKKYILDFTRYEFADRLETQDRFYDILNQLKVHIEAQDKKWDEQNKKWDEQNKKLDQVYLELRQEREAQEKKWEEQNKRWEANQQELYQLNQKVAEQSKRHERSIGALGARWGLQSEKAFRDALAGILEQSFGVQVLNINEYDKEGIVFGRPDQVELDVVVKNGLLIICELKSSIDKAGMYIFERKVRFYEKLQQQTANRMIVISPMIDARAHKVAEKLGIETYGDSLDVQSL